jgi:predicted amidohydrolase
MRAHLIQLDIAWEDKPANYDRVEHLIARASPGEGDLVVLPEMFDTGFSLNTGVTADTQGATLRQLCQIAGDLGVYIQGSRTVRECHRDKAHNRALIIGPGGEPIAEYSKVHPFSYGREPEAFEGGREVVTYDWSAGGPAQTLRVCPAICYDLRFPELFRLGLKRGAEVFAIGANWPASRAAHWRALLIARAIENQAFVLGVNRAGSDPHLSYQGGSIAVGPRGDVLGELGSEESVLSVDLNPAHVRSWRETFPAWKDLRLI